MAFKLERKKRIVKEIELNGEIIRAEITPDAIIQQFNRCRNDIIRAQAEIAKAQTQKTADSDLEKSYQAFGDAIISLLKLVFGQENTGKIIEFYQSNYTEMIEMIFPFIEDEIIPEFQEAVRSERERLKSRYAGRRMGR
jgi:hypothetical protein